MKKYVPLLLMGLLLGSPSSHAAVDFEVVSADESSLHLRIILDGAVLEPAGDGKARVILQGAHPAGQPGLPALPMLARWIALPPTGQATVSVLSSRSEDLGQARLLPVELPRLQPGDGDEQVRLVHDRAEGDAYDAFRVSIADVAQLGEPVYQRRQRMVPLLLRPVLYDAASGRVQVVRELELRIQWPRSSAGQASTDADPVILSSVLNPEQASGWSTHAPAQAQLLAAAREPGRRAAEILDPGLLAADGIRLRVDHSGIVRVTVADLISSGALPTDIARSWLRIVQLRPSAPSTPGYPAPLLVDVPVHFLGNPDQDGLINSGDELFFHALRVEDDADSLQAGAQMAAPPLPWGESNPNDLIAPRYVGDSFNSDNVYFVYLMSPPPAGWARMEAVVLPASSGSPEASYMHREHFEGNQGYRDEPYDPWVERYAWNRHSEADVVRVLRLYDPLPGANMVVKWIAGGHISGSTIPVNFSLRQDGDEVALSSLNLGNSGVMTEWSRTLVAPPFEAGAVDFRMRRIFNSVDVAVNSFVDHVELEYAAGFTVSTDQLRFSTGQQGADTDVEVVGYSRPDLICFDVTDPHQPRWIDLSAANIEDRSAGGSDNYVLSLRVPQVAGEELEFVAAPRVRLPRIGRSSIEADPIADIFDVVNDLQVLALGPEQFRTQTERWIAWREQTYAGSGWNFDFIDVQQVYDQFSGGLQSPWAIRDFVQWAWVNWDAIALLLVGDGNEDVLDGGGDAGPNHIPPSLHLQDFDASRELLASDKWYGLFGYTPVGNQRYPQGLRVTSDVVVGRFPVADESALATHIDKLMAYEQNDLDGDWRKRSLWVADDAYSSDLIGAGQGCYRLQPIEDGFRLSQAASAGVVDGALDSLQSGQLQDANDFTQSCRTGVACENLPSIRGCFAANHSADFIDRWSEGWLWLSYQGHANFNVLGHENLVLTGSLSLLRNDGRPFVFFGMGCHISDFLRSEEGREGPSLGELLMRPARAGAIATYGSSGFEFLTPNAAFMQVLGETMFVRRVTDSPVFGAGLRNQWILGDVMARAELETLPLSLYRVDEMVSQYNLLGDPLLRMDAGAPRMEATHDGSPLGEGAFLVADAGLATVGIDLDLVDETGLSHVEITDSEGRDYSALLPPLTGPDPRLAQLALAVPVYPQAYSVEIATFDEARPGLRRTVLGLQVGLPLDFFVDGEPVVPGSNVPFEEGVVRSMRVEFASPVDLIDSDIVIDYIGVEILALDKVGSGRDWIVSFDALGRAGEEPGVLNLILQGHSTLVAGGGQGPGTGALKVLRHVVFPNPMQGEARVVVEVEGTVDRARLSVYDLAGNEVSSREYRPTPVTAIVLDFDARDRGGDELANGTYFYRISVEGPAGSARSDMGRIVIMR